ncbi:drebrin-like protein isoform X10 [Amblyraja radiata]|uniref:drebrin-like protein isoform X10 n=1 Tax=Amblyraja radiata TaxID=386614 RepID=UPI001402A9D9|nr:drebrin-like protein isoform X10 [Amblyraja radiata]
MAANLSRNGPALQAAYQDVLNDKTGTDWALFTYEGNSNDLRVAGTGDGGLEEMVEELSSGKVMYAFCRVKDPNSGLPKCVLINWTGEGVKDARKGLCANHVSTMGNFLKGAHVTINARADEDVELDEIIGKVAKASGANYNFHKESSRYQDTTPQGPVGSVYKKTNAMSEIRNVNKEGFWAQTEKDEAKRREEDKKRRTQEHEGLEQERKARERQESDSREQQYRDKSSQIDQQKQFQKKQDSVSRENEKQRWNEQEQEYQTEMRKGFKRSQSIEKASEAASIIAQRSMNPKELFKDRERGKLADPSLFNASTQPEMQPSAEAQSETERVEAEPKEEPQTDWNAPAEQAQSEEGYSWQFHHSDTVEHEDIYQDAEGNAEEQQKSEPVAASVPQVTTEQAAPDEQNIYEATETPVPGLCARALYDYQAADSTEISFDPDDIISDIEQIDEGWWRGYAADGTFGMFPANYVELLTG